MSCFLLVRPATACSLHTSSAVLRISKSSKARNGGPGSAKRNSHISQLGLGGVPPRQAPLRSARRHTLRVHGTPARECRAIKSRRHAAISSCRADAPDRSCRAAAPSSLCRAPAQTRRANQGAGAGGQVRLRQRLLLECSEPGVRLAGRPRCRGGQAVAAAGHLARCQAQSGAHRRQRARVAHTSGLDVSSRWCWCWCWCARCAQERSGSPLDDTLSQRELPHSRHTGTLQLDAVRAVPFELLSSVDD